MRLQSTLISTVTHILVNLLALAPEIFWTRNDANSVLRSVRVCRRSCLLLRGIVSIMSVMRSSFLGEQDKG